MQEKISRKEKVAILAPHVDDELIGCWRLIEAGLVNEVYYFNDLTPERIEEAECVADFFGFTPYFIPDHQMSYDLQTTYYFPAIQDRHPHHQALNFASRVIPNARYYSIDMNYKFDVLSAEDARVKKIALEEFYPSQRKLLSRDDKYHLFEADLLTDLVCSQILASPEMTQTVELFEDEISLNRLTIANSIIGADPHRSRKVQLGKYLFEYNK